jgi:hypothetical protein
VCVVTPVIERLVYARILALAPNIDPLVGALGAPAGERPGLLSPAMRDSPALATAVVALIGTNTSGYILPTWAEVAPAG